MHNTLQKENISYEIPGGEPVIGNIHCMGAKNLATKAIIAALLADDITYLHNVPHIGDVEITEKMLNSSAVKTEWIEKNTLKIDASTLKHHSVSMPDSRTNRIPILLLSILLHRFGKAEVPTVGGDDIGKRNVDFHIMAIKKFGANIKCENNKYIAEATRLKSCHIELPYPSVGATETCIFLGVLAKGTSVIHNIATEPEIKELIAMLRSMGAIIFLESDRTLIIHGVEKLYGTRMYLIGDRIEAASWAVLACASNGRIKVHGTRPDLLGNFLSYYTMVGGGYTFLEDNVIEFYRKHTLTHTIIETNVHPGFATDWQQVFAVLLTQAQGTSIIHETVHDQRFGYLNILNKLGANTQIVNKCLGSSVCRYKGYDYPHSAIINGPTALKATNDVIVVPDLRAGLAYIVAAVIAKGTTKLSAVEQIERGYGDIRDKLKDTNLKIKRICL